jgi:hypothetical protein
MSRKPLMEAWPFQVLEWNEVEESGGEGKPVIKRMHVKGVLHRADEKNGNDRIYPFPVLERETKKINERIQKGETVFMQADHPSDGQSRIVDTVAILENAALDPKTKEVIGNMTIVNTAKGRDLAEIIRANGKPGISARGFGSVIRGEVGGVKGDIIQDDYRLVTYDFVVGQSVRGAVVTSFQEQAGNARDEGEQDMDIKTLTLDELRAQRPDLLQTIEADAKTKAEATVEAKVAEQVTAKVAAAEPQIEARLRSEFEAKSPCNDEGKMEALLKAYAEKKNLLLVPKDGASQTEATLAALKQQLTETNTALAALKDKTESVTAEQERAKVTNYIMDKTKGEKFRVALIERLQSCKNVAEVDAKFEAEKAFLAKHIPEGMSKGKSFATEEPGSQTSDKTVTTKSGLTLNEQQQQARRMAGIRE